MSSDEDLSAGELQLEIELLQHGQREMTSNVQEQGLWLQAGQLMPIIACRQDAHQATIDGILEVMPDIEFEWLWPRSGYDVTMLLDYILENEASIPRGGRPVLEPDDPSLLPIHRLLTQSTDNNISPTTSASKQQRLSEFVNNDYYGLGAVQSADGLIVLSNSKSPSKANIRHAESDIFDGDIKKRRVMSVRQTTEVYLAAQTKMYDAIVKEIINSKYEDILLDEDRREEMLTALKKHFSTVHEEFMRETIRWFPPVPCFLIAKLIETGMEDYLLSKDDSRLHQLWDIEAHVKEGERPDFIFWMPDWMKPYWKDYLNIVNKDYSAEVSEFDCLVCFEHFPICRSVTCTNVYTPVENEQLDGLIQEERHRICIDCVKGMAAAAGDDASVAKGGAGLKCVEQECEGVIMFAHVSPLLDDDMRTRLHKRLQQEALMTLSGLESCKYCQFTAEFTDSKEANPTFECPECKAIFCRSCKLDWSKHKSSTGLPAKCQDVLSPEDFSRLRLEEELSNAILRQCVCGAQFVKEAGCNKMTCRCGKTMCYVCRAQNVTYDHFKDNLRCSLHENHAEIDRRNLEAVRTNARQDPMLKHLVNRY